jgi:GTPase SAR1 family protein
MTSETTANLWSSLLKESSKRSKLPEATCIFVGDQNVGKNATIEKICAQTENKDLVGRIKDIISYNFIDLDEGSSDAESVTRINVWSFSSKTFDGCFEHVISPKIIDRVRY